MTDYTELKRLAEAATAGPWSMCGEADGSQGFEIIQDIWNEHGTHTGKDVVVYEWSDESDPLGVIYRADAEFIAAANPVAVLALIADLDEARNGMKHSCAIRLKKRIELLETQRDQLIADNERLTKAVGLQVIRRFVGDDDQKNIDELVAAGIQVDKELIVQLKAENERLRADYAGLARFNPEWDRVAAAQDSVREHMAMVVQLKAENAGLKTGYEAYERVNAELKAEVARATEREILQLAEIEALRRERDARHPFKPFHEPAIGFTGCVICGVYTDHGGLPCMKTRATADAGLGQGEQS